MTGPLVELTIESLAAGGDGVGREAGGRVVFVPRTAPGDLVRVELTEQKKRFARGEPVEVVRGGPDRVDAPCPYFRSGACGGCQWQHLAGPAQHRAKQAITEAALRHLVAGGLEVRPLLDPVAPYGWRRRARLHFRRPADDAPARIGYFERRSHRIVDLEMCPQLEPALERALAALRQVLPRALRREGEIHIVLGHKDEVHVAIAGECTAGAAAGLVGQAGIAGVSLGKERFGARNIEVEPGLRGRADQFTQVSRAGNQVLGRLVDEASAPRAGRRILELYAGSGNFTRVLRDGAAEVVAVDVGRSPKSRGNVDWREGPAAAVAADLAAAGERFDLIVIDPPRTGAAEVVPSLLALAPAHIIYVSCDPATLARDLGALAAGGYRARWAQPVDLMPQTAHVEVIALLART